VAAKQEGNTNSPELSLLKILPLAYHHSHFLAATSHLFSLCLFGAAHFFYSRAVLDDLHLAEKKTSYCNTTVMN